MSSSWSLHRVWVGRTQFCFGSTTLRDGNLVRPLTSGPHSLETLRRRILKTLHLRCLAPVSLREGEVLPLQPRLYRGSLHSVEAQRFWRGSGETDPHPGRYLGRNRTPSLRRRSRPPAPTLRRPQTQGSRLGERTLRPSAAGSSNSQTTGSAGVRGWSVRTDEERHFITRSMN